MSILIDFHPPCQSCRTHSAHYQHNIFHQPSLACLTSRRNCCIPLHSGAVGPSSGGDSEMNPLTQIKNTQKVSRKEWQSGFTEDASWHARFKHSAYIFAGGLSYDLTDGDLLAVFAQYGEVVDVNLVRDRDTNKSRGFAFLAYEDQRSTVLAVDNLSGAKVAGRVIRVEHVDDYKRKRKEMGDLSDNEGEEDGGNVEGDDWRKDKHHNATDGNAEPSGRDADDGQQNESIFALMNAHLKEKSMKAMEDEKKRKKKEKRKKHKDREKSKKKRKERGDSSDEEAHDKQKAHRHHEQAKYEHRRQSQNREKQHKDSKHGRDRMSHADRFDRVEKRNGQRDRAR